MQGFAYVPLAILSEGNKLPSLYLVTVVPLFVENKANPEIPRIGKNIRSRFMTNEHDCVFNALSLSNLSKIFPRPDVCTGYTRIETTTTQFTRVSKQTRCSGTKKILHFNCLFSFSLFCVTNLYFMVMTIKIAHLVSYVLLQTNLYYPRMRVGNVFGHVCVCVSVCVCLFRL